MAGGALGLLGASAADRVLAAVAFGARASEPGQMAALLVLITPVMLLAIWLPTRRALRQDPGRVLRSY